MHPPPTSACLKYVRAIAVPRPACPVPHRPTDASYAVQIAQHVTVSCLPATTTKLVDPKSNRTEACGGFNFQKRILLGSS
jgi:hypothetical protein